jgi:hypothetical protein
MMGLSENNAQTALFVNEIANLGALRALKKTSDGLDR